MPSTVSQSVEPKTVEVSYLEHLSWLYIIVATSGDILAKSDSQYLVSPR